MTKPPNQYEPCPFCGSNSIRIVDWQDADGEFDAVECNVCKGAAPADIWNTRRSPNQAWQQKLAADCEEELHL